MVSNVLRVLALFLCLLSCSCASTRTDWGSVTVGERAAVLESSRLYVRYARYYKGDDKDAIVDLIIKDADENWGAKIDSRAGDEKLVSTAIVCDGPERKTVRLEYEKGTTEEVSIFPDSPVLEITYLAHDVNIFDQSRFTGEWVIYGAEDWLTQRRGLGPMEHIPENERPVREGMYPGHPDSYYRKSWAPPDALNYHGFYIMGLHDPETGRGYGRVMPVEHVDVIKLLFDPVKKPNLLHIRYPRCASLPAQRWLCSRRREYSKRHRIQDNEKCS